MIKKWIDGRKWILLSLLLIVVVSIINASPRGYIVAGGDVFQNFNFSKVFTQYRYVWSDISGEGVFLQAYSYIIYYFFIYIVSLLLHLSPSGQSFLYYLVFLAGSFLSFYWSMPLFQKEKNEQQRIVFSLLYTFNIFTYQNFFSTLGFSPFNFLYILIPIIFGLTYKYFRAENAYYKYLAFLGLVFALSNIVNGNLPFFIALVLFLSFFILSIFFVELRGRQIVTYFLKGVGYVLVYFLAVFWSLVPQITEMLRQINVYNTGDIAFGLQNWILWQAVKLPSPFFLVFDIHSYGNNVILLYAGLSLFIITIISLLVKRNKKPIIHIFFLLLLLAVFLLNKGNGILPDALIQSIFSNPFLGSLRSHEKVIIFLPFFLLIITYLSLDIGEKVHRYLTYVLILSSICITYPMFLGQLQTYYSASFKQGENYKNAQYAYLNKIPEGYFQVSALLNKNAYDQKILRVPYNVINSINWVNFPKWKHVGSDPTLQLFSNATVQMNQFGSFGNWNYGKFWNKQKDRSSTWLLPFTGLLNAKYIIYQKDVNQKFINQTQDKIHYYEDNKLITKVSENDDFALYRVSQQFFLPHFYTANNVIVSSKPIEDLPQLLSSKGYTDRTAILLKGQSNDKSINIPQLSKNSAVIEYKKIDPTKYRVILHNVSKNVLLVFSELFHSGWKVYPVHLSSVPSHIDSTMLKNYPIFGEDQANKEVLTNLVDHNLVSNVHGRKISFVSRNIKDTIQNNNLNNGTVLDVFFKKPLDEKYHVMVNGYANAWDIDPKSICSSELSLCKRNNDGTYNLELLVEFWPQQLYNIGIIISAVTFLGACAYLIKYRIRKRRDS